MQTVRALRSAAGLTQDQLAAKAGLSQSLISSLEMGRVPSPTLDTLERLATAFGCDINTVIAAVRASVAESEAA